MLRRPIETAAVTVHVEFKFRIMQLHSRLRPGVCPGGTAGPVVSKSVGSTLVHSLHVGMC